jgi:hypothetical protein
MNRNGRGTLLPLRTNENRNRTRMVDTLVSRFAPVRPRAETLTLGEALLP